MGRVEPAAEDTHRERRIVYALTTKGRGLPPSVLKESVPNPVPQRLSQTITRSQEAGGKLWQGGVVKVPQRVALRTARQYLRPRRPPAA
eukprot:3457155-Pleurochrysis_carterae.AAC.1